MQPNRILTMNVSQSFKKCVSRSLSLGDSSYMNWSVLLQRKTIRETYDVQTTSPKNTELTGKVIRIRDENEASGVGEILSGCVKERSEASGRKRLHKRRPWYFPSPWKL